MKGTIIQGMDVLDTLNFIGRKNKQFQANILNQLESILGRDSEEFKLVRKIFLDAWNSYTRSILNSIFGNIEESK